MCNAPISTTNDIDVTLSNHGSVIMFSLLTPAACEWVDENAQAADWAWMGLGFSCEPRMATDVAQGMVEAGLEVAA